MQICKKQFRLLLEFYIIYQNDSKENKINTATRVVARIDNFLSYCKTDAFHTISYKKQSRSVAIEMQ